MKARNNYKAEAAVRKKKWEKFFGTTSKILLWFWNFNAASMMWVSYYLAFKGQEQIAENLSETVCTVIVASVLTYGVKAAFENVFRFNPLFGGESEYPEDKHKSNDLSNENGEE